MVKARDTLMLYRWKQPLVHHEEMLGKSGHFSETSPQKKSYDWQQMRDSSRHTSITVKGPFPSDFTCDAISGLDVSDNFFLLFCSPQQ